VRVHVYRNLRYQDQLAWSVVANEGPTRGRVMEVVGAALVEGVTFVVRESGRQRVLRERSKNVHAFIRGKLVRSVPLGCERDEASVEAMTLGRCDLIRVSYDPYLSGHFFVVETGKPIDSSPLVVATSSGVYAANSKD